MNAFALTGRSVLAVMAGAALITLLLYLLRPPARRVAVPSLLVWARLGAARRTRRYGIRWWASLLLALLVGAALAATLARPEIRSLGWSVAYTVVVLDDSATLASRTADGATRWLHAVERARRLIADSGSAAQIMLLDTMGYASIPEYVSPSRALAALARLQPVRLGNARLPEIPTDGGHRPRLILVTDGVAPLKPPAGWQVASVFEAAENVAVTAFEVRPSERDPTVFDAFVQVRNHGRSSRDVSVRIRDSGNGAVEQTWMVAPGSLHEQVVDVSTLKRGALKLQVAAAGDAFAADDVAYAVMPQGGARHVVLVSNGEPALSDALRLLPGVRLDIVKPAAYSAATTADLCVFDRFAPRDPPACAALLFQAPRTGWLPRPMAGGGKVGVTRWSDTDRVAGAVAWRNLRLQRALLSELPADPLASEALVYAKGVREGALVTAGTLPRRWIDVGFALQESNFGMNSGFPVFLAEALRWLAGSDDVIRRGPGSVEVAPLRGDVFDNTGRRVTTVRSAAGAAFVADTPGVFEVRDAVRRGYIVVNEQDPEFGDVNRIRTVAPAATASGVGRTLPMQPWMFVLLGAVLLLLIEWTTFCRRVTE